MVEKVENMVDFFWGGGWPALLCFMGKMDDLIDN